MNNCKLLLIAVGFSGMIYLLATQAITLTSLIRLFN
jgi:hypothetical protein